MDDVTRVRSPAAEARVRNCPERYRNVRSATVMQQALLAASVQARGADIAAEYLVAA